MSLLKNQGVKSVLVLSLFLSSITSLRAQAPAQVSKPQSEAVATFNDTTITEEELRQAAAGDLDKLNLQAQQMKANLAQTEHRVLESNLDRLLANKMFDAEAAKRGITREALIKIEVDAKITEPSQQDISAFYEANKQQINRPLDQVTDQIRQYLKAQSRSKAISDFANSLKAEYKVTTLLQPLRENVGTEGSPSRGPKEAPVTIVEFSDFQCPFCMRLSKTLHEVSAKYGDQVRVVYRQFPLFQIHPFAEKAAEASLCAADQNHFWEMHDLMFATQGQLKEEDLKADAVKLNLDPGAFNSCLSSGKYADRVRLDEREGLTLGVSATPALFINGRFIAGALPLSDVSKIIDEEISFKSSPKTGAIASPAPSDQASIKRP